ncbi:MAG: hypothetical protein ACK5NG_00285, partial [Chthoniobacterales bacterium]
SSGGLGDTVKNMQPLNAASVTSENNLSAITTSAPSALSFEVKPASLTPVSVATVATVASANTGGSGDGNDSADTGGKGGGSGKGIGLGYSSATWPGTKKALGNVGEGWGRPGKDALVNQDIILIVDQSQRIRAKKKLHSGVQNLINALKATNNVIGELGTLTGIMAKNDPNHYKIGTEF